MTEQDPHAPRGDTGRVPARRRSEEVYWTLRQEIVDGVLRPNAPLVEDEIAVRLGVSRTPVRESMQRLMADGLIRSQRRRWVVHEYTREEVAHLYEVRAGLESQAARLAALRATSAQRGDIAAWRARMTSPTADALCDRISNNDSFHDSVTAASGNPRLLEMIRANRLFHFNKRIAALYSTEEIAISSRQHGDLITAVCEGEADRAGAVAREHTEFSLGVILRKLF
ncbi:GntR family transcriptional regulator [Streptomyces paludis]|uniref:GntR family transcriptional regulator n=1 Tax=Streptomyces paludis TaxID=2282738 RepID=A0A345HYS6_9ACTN|nr:GntR family transcriptional regulator [Streptomyces paludis]AXG81850.1 GntR family transcriptional regulator [Streptomyces paludis]